MSEHPSFDRKKGFVALPVEILDIDLSPGAFRTLVELCRMANAEGYCWPSLDQLSQRSGRSKSAISGYLKELRSADLIETEEQQTASGYNYRLKYRVTFWQDWRSSLRGKTTPRIERSVQPSERLKDSKNHIHKNHSAMDLDSNLDHLLGLWARCFKGVPYPSAKIIPTSQMLASTNEHLGRGAPEPISTDIAAQLTKLWTELRLDSGEAHVSEQVEWLHKSGFSESETAEIIVHIRKHWPQHWRQFPTIQQFEKLVKASGITAHAQKKNLLKSYLKRWGLAQKHLRNDTPSCSLNTAFIPAKSGMNTQKYPWI